MWRIIYYTTSTVGKSFYCNNTNTTEFKMIDTKNFFTAYVVMYKLIT